MTAVTSWRTDEPCPVCATGLTLIEEDAAQTGECRLCGWAGPWTADTDGGEP